MRKYLFIILIKIVMRKINISRFHLSIKLSTLNAKRYQTILIFCSHINDDSRTICETAHEREKARKQYFFVWTEALSWLQLLLLIFFRLVFIRHESTTYPTTILYHLIIIRWRPRKKKKLHMTFIRVAYRVYRTSTWKIWNNKWNKFYGGRKYWKRHGTTCTRCDRPDGEYAVAHRIRCAIPHGNNFKAKLKTCYARIAL